MGLPVSSRAPIAKIYVSNLLEREDITKELTGLPLTGLPKIAREVDDERQRGQQQEIAAAAENQAGRSTGPVDRHAQHARGLRQSTGRSTA